MTEPKRWLDDGAPPAIERMLRAGGSEHPSEAALERALTAAGVGGAVLTATTASAASTNATSTGAATVTASTVSGIFTKWSVLALVVTSVAGVTTGVTIARREPVRAAAPFVPRPLATPPVARVAQPETATPVTSPTPAATPSVVTQRAKGTPAIGSEEPATESEPVDGALPEETKCVDRARAAVAAGNPSAALTALDDYEARFPVRHYAPEALYLRMTALLAQGRTPDARRVASHLLEAYPKSAQASRAEAVVSRSNP